MAPAIGINKIGLQFAQIKSTLICKRKLLNIASISRWRKSKAIAF